MSRNFDPAFAWGLRERLGRWPCYLGWHRGRARCGYCRKEDEDRMAACLPELEGLIAEGGAIRRDLVLHMTREQK